MPIKRHSIALLMVAMLTACSSVPSSLDRDFGESVHHMVSGQVFDAATTKVPSQEAVTGVDANKALLDMNAVYGKNDAKKQTVKQAGGYKISIGK